MDAPVSRRGVVRTGALAGVGLPLVVSQTLIEPTAAQEATPMTASSETTDCVIAGDGKTETTTNIDAGAPVISRQEIDIAVPLQVVWDLHTDVAAWPSWNPDISKVVLERPLAAGSSFRWSSGGTSSADCSSMTKTPRTTTCR